MFPKYNTRDVKLEGKKTTIRTKLFLRQATKIKTIDEHEI